MNQNLGKTHGKPDLRNLKLIPLVNNDYAELSTSIFEYNEEKVWGNSNGEGQLINRNSGPTKLNNQKPYTSYNKTLANFLHQNKTYQTILEHKYSGVTVKEPQTNNNFNSNNSNEKLTRNQYLNPSPRGQASNLTPNNFSSGNLKAGPSPKKGEKNIFKEIVGSEFSESSEEDLRKIQDPNTIHYHTYDNFQKNFHNPSIRKGARPNLSEFNNPDQ
jgi:hypothetical protein